MDRRFEKYQKMIFGIILVIALIISISELLWYDLRILALPVFCFGSFYIFFAVFWGNGGNNDQ
jgi:hypothetical protein